MMTEEIKNVEAKIIDHLGERETRIAKVHKLKSIGVIPYAQSFSKRHAIEQLRVEYHNQAKDADPLLEKGAENIYSTA